MTASPSPSAPLRLLAVHAHPDDESSKGAATMAMYAAAGVDVLVATCTDGSRGDIQNPAMEGEPHPKRDMAGARRLEMDARGQGPGRPAALAGLRRFGAAGRRSAAAAAGRLLRHAAAGAGRRAAGPAGPRLQAAGDPQLRRERRLPAPGPHHGAPRRRRGLRSRRGPGPVPGNRGGLGAQQAVLRPRLQPGTVPRPALRAGGSRPAVARTPNGWPPGWKPTPRGTPRRAPTHPTTTQIECGDFFEARDDALRAHRTQVDPEGFFFAVSAGDAAPGLAVGGLLADPVPGSCGAAGKGPLRRAKIDATGISMPCRKAAVDSSTARSRRRAATSSIEGFYRAFLAHRPGNHPGAHPHAVAAPGPVRGPGHAGPAGLPPDRLHRGADRAADRGHGAAHPPGPLPCPGGGGARGRRGGMQDQRPGRRSRRRHRMPRRRHRHIRADGGATRPEVNGDAGPGNR